MSREHLSQFLLKRHEAEPEEQPNKEMILESDELVGAIARVWTDNRTAIEAVVRARMMAARDHILKDCMAEEVTVYRQVMLELAAVLADFDRYTTEASKRPKAENAEPTIEDNKTKDNSSM